MPSGSVALDAWVIGGRHRHHRTHDHFGADSDLYIVTTDALGSWPAGTPIRYVLEDLYNRQLALESNNHQIRVAHLDGYVLAPTTTASGGRGVFWLNALIHKNQSTSFTLDADVIKGGVITLNAWVGGIGTFHLYAWVS